jgi:hypothetical protein
MKMVKSLLLGSAAGLVAVAGAQAADLPVKAKPVQYVKICSLYGVGFYYIPGTDMCIKIGGWVRAEYGWGSNGSFTWGPFNNNSYSRVTNDSVMRARGYITADARNQSEYGTVRGYIAVGLSENDVGLNTAANTFSANRAFIQWAGFTFGRAQSFFDFYSVPATSYWGIFPASDTGDPGWLVFGYTAQFGNGFSATISAEERRITQILYVDEGEGVAIGALGTGNLGSFGPGGFGDTTGCSPTGACAAVFPRAGAYGGFRMPDIVANLRVDQAWGSAQIMGALHQDNAAYYGSSSGTGRANGAPDDKLGFAVGAGIKLNAPFIGQGDYFQAQVTYAQGATKYVMQTPNTNWGKNDGAFASWGLVTDAVYSGFLGGTGSVAPSDLELTTAWNVNAAYEHFWNPRWRTSIYGGYAEISYNQNATSIICTGGLPSSGNPLPAGCDPDWQTWWVGSRTQWNVTKDFYMGLDVLYSKMQTASAFLLNGTSGPSQVCTNFSCSAFTTGKDVDNWAFRFRVHRDFYP